MTRDAPPHPVTPADEGHEQWTAQLHDDQTARFCAEHKRWEVRVSQFPEAVTTRGGRNPNTLADFPPVAAYNLGWQESRDQSQGPELSQEEIGHIRQSLRDVPVGGLVTIQADVLRKVLADDGWTFGDIPADSWLTGLKAGTTYVTQSHGIRIDADDSPPEYFDGEGAEVDTREEAWMGEDVPTQAEEPVEWRMQRAFLNGFREGFERGARGLRLDYS